MISDAIDFVAEDSGLPVVMGSQADDIECFGLMIARTRAGIVVFEDNVANPGTLINGLDPVREIVVLNSTKDGLHQIAEALAGRSGIDALHIISHSAASSAKPGALTLTGKVLPGTMPTCRPSGQA